MAVAFSNTSNHGNPSSRGSGSYTHTAIPAGGCILIFVAGASSSQSATAVTVGGVNAPELIASQSNPSGANGLHCRVFGLANPASGDQTVAITVSGTHVWTAWSLTFTGAHASTPFGTPVASADSSSDNVSSAVNDLVVDGIFCDLENTCAGSSLSLPGGSGQTERSTQLCTDNLLKIGSSTEPGAGTVTMSWTAPSVALLHLAVNIAQAAGGGGPANLPRTPSGSEIDRPFNMARGRR